MPPTRSRLVVAADADAAAAAAAAPSSITDRRSDARTDVLSPNGHLPLSWRRQKAEQVRRRTTASVVSDSISRLIFSAVVTKEGAAWKL